MRSRTSRTSDGRSTKRAGAAGRRTARPSPRCDPEGKLAVGSSPSRRWTGGRSRSTTSVVARYDPDSTQITNSVKAASSHFRLTRNTTTRDPDHHGNHQTSGHRRADPGEVGERRRSPLREPAVEVVVPLLEAVRRHEQPGQQKTRCNGQADEERVADDDHEQEDAYGMRRADPTGETLRRSSGGRFEHRDRSRGRHVSAATSAAGSAAGKGEMTAPRPVESAASMASCLPSGHDGQTRSRCPSSCSCSSPSPAACS